MEEFEDRSLEEEDFLALLTHGKRLAGEEIIICMGVTEKGYKKVLGFTQATTERKRPQNASDHRAPRADQRAVSGPNQAGTQL